jgi:tetratricopeptide (TPR) repeat protein
MRLFDLCTLPPSTDFADSEAAPLTLPSFIPAERHEAIIQYWIRSRLQPSFMRVEVDWRGALYTNSAKMLDRVVMRHGVANVALIVRVIDPDLDLEAIGLEPKIMQYDHVLIVCPHPAKNVRVSRLRYMAAGVTEHLEEAYATLAPTHRLNKDAWTHAATVCRVLEDPAECVEVANSLVSMQLEGLAPDRVPDALKSGVVLRQLNTTPMRELVALLAVLAGWDVEKTQSVFPEGASAEAARAELVERSVLVGDRLSGWAAWLYDHERMRGLLGPTLPSQSRRVPPWDAALKAVFEALGVDYELPEQAQAARLLWSDAGVSRVTGALDRTRWELDRADETTRTASGKLAAEKLVAVARLRNDEQRYDDAEALYRAALECDPGCADALAGLGWIAQRIKKAPDEAERLLREAVRLAPDHVDALNDLAELLIRAKSDLPTAETHLRHGLKLAPENTIAMVNLARIQGYIGNHDEAELLLREAIRLEPDFFLAWIALGIHLMDNRPDYAEAEQCLQTAVRLKPNLRKVHGALALLLQCKLERPKEAIPYYRFALDQPPDPNYLANLAGLLLASGEPPNVAEAIQHIRQCEELLLAHIQHSLQDSIFLETSFYLYAHQLRPHKILRVDISGRRTLLRRLHQNSPDRLLPPLQAIRKLLEAGVRSPGFNLTPNVEAARRAEHPHADRVALLAQIITEGAPLSLMDGQWDEPEATTSAPPA